MRTTVTIEDAPYQQALELADPGVDKAELFREALRTFIRVQAGKRLAASGGRAPHMPYVTRRRGVRIDQGTGLPLIRSPQPVNAEDVRALGDE